MRLKKSILAIVLAVGSLVGVEAQERHSKVQFTLFPPVSTNGRYAKKYTNDVSLNLLVGVSENETALGMSGLVSIINNDFRGVQFAGFGNVVGINGRGGLFAGFANVVGDKFSGGQFAGFGNYIGDGSAGAQFAGFGNIADGDFSGWQFAGFGNFIGGDASGAQFAGFGNFVDGDFSGGQFAGFGNFISGDASRAQFAGFGNFVDGDFSGVQFAGFGNVIDGDFSGVQLSGAMNVAGIDLNGVQFAGLANVIGGDVRGVQFAGLFNFAYNVCGTQVGVVNVANQNDTPIGLVNIIKHGEMGVALTYNDLGTVAATFRSGSRITYGILGLGYNTKLNSDNAWSIVGGIGAHINVAKWLRLNNELIYETMDVFGWKKDEDVSFRAGYSLLPAFRMGKHFEIFGGPGIYYQQSKDSAFRNIFASNPLWDDVDGRKLRQLTIGWQAGVQFVF